MKSLKEAAVFRELIISSVWETMGQIRQIDTVDDIRQVVLYITPSK